MIDLHVHSNQSDGSLSPEELIDLAAEKGVTTIALCDHDTTAGLDRFSAYASGREINAITGVEMSATWEKGNCHILGLGVCSGFERLEDVLEKTRESRDGRNLKIIEKLNGLGLSIELEEAEALAGGDVVSRPHMAQVLLQKGYVSSVQEAFDRFLAKDAPAYVDRYRLLPENAVKLLHEAGAVVVLAHPSQLRLSVENLDVFVKNLIPYGLSGIEAYTPYATPEKVKEYRGIAERYGLVVTGGSDFHGESKPDHHLGCYIDGTPIPEEAARGVLKMMGEKQRCQ